MTIQSRTTGKIWLSSTYSDWKTHTVEVNFAPKATSASVAMCQTYIWNPPVWGGVGIKSFEYRDTPSGPNKKTNYGDIWESSAYHNLMTRVIFAAGIVNGTCIGSWTIDFWS